MPKHSAGVLLYRHTEGRLEVLLVHPGGPYWARKDEGAWTIPKGEPNEGEDARAAAQREFEEETGGAVAGEMIALEPVRQPGGKIVQAFACAGEFDPAALRSNTFLVEWPPRSGRQREFPEVDRAAWFAIDEAEKKINVGQRPLLGQLVRILAR
jgi:predicted NUDIX family NTP pyrophosphohydrolase